MDLFRVMCQARDSRIYYTHELYNIGKFTELIIILVNGKASF